MHTPLTPRSRTPSRVGTPISSPSRLPPVRLAPSVSSRVYSHGTTSALQTPVVDTPPVDVLLHGSGFPLEGPASSASSVLNVEATTVEDMLVQEADVETLSGQRGVVEESAGKFAADEESKQYLRNQLRQTLNKKDSSVDLAQQSRRRKGKSVEIDEMSHTPVDTYPPRQYFVLTNAGKPVFVSQQRDESSDSFTSIIGIMQALISVFLDDEDKIRCINAGNTRITFLLRSSLYYVCVSSWSEPESVTRFHLEYLHLQILGVFSAEQLRKMFERRTNFDLRRLLSGAEPLLYSLLARLEWDLAMSTSSLHCLKVEPMLRKSVADILVPTSKIKDILYVILIAQERVITLVRPKKHSIHPSDLHVLVNTIHSPSIMNSSASASYVPVCLPKFNPAAFVNAYVMFLRPETASSPTTPGPPAEGTETVDVSPAGSSTSQPEGAQSVPATPTSARTPARQPTSEIGLVCVGGSADLEAARNWCDTVSRRLVQDGLLQALSDAIARGQTEYSVADLGIPGLRHFVYKSRSHVQITMPLFEDPYDNLDEKRRLVTLYQTLYDSIHAKSGQGSTLKLQYIRTEKESVMGWITQPFELYLALSPRLPKSAVVNAANAVTRWVQKEEKRLFLRDAPVF